MVRIAGLILLLLTLIGPMTTPKSVLAFDSPLEQGEQIFSQNCAACHMEAEM